MYKLTLIFTDGQMEERLENDYNRELTPAAIAAEGCAIMRDYGAVLRFEHESDPTTTLICGVPE